jgi:tetratricopeptide (TPR) repeat protein
MKPPRLLSRGVLAALIVAAFAFAGCQKGLTPYLAMAKKNFADKNYVDTIDALNGGLTYWKESEGADKKAEAYELLGKSYRALRNSDKAVEAYQQAAKISPNRFDVYYDMASIYLTKGFADQAERSFRQALRNRPDDALALLGLGNSLYTQRKLDEARAAFQRILDTSPGVKDALESLAALNRLARKPGRAPAVKASGPENTAFHKSIRRIPRKKTHRATSR